MKCGLARAITDRMSTADVADSTDLIPVHIANSAIAPPPITRAVLQSLRSATSASKSAARELQSCNDSPTPTSATRSTEKKFPQNKSKQNSRRCTSSRGDRTPIISRSASAINILLRQYLEPHANLSLRPLPVRVFLESGCCSLKWRIRNQPCHGQSGLVVLVDSWCFCLARSPKF